MDAGLGFSLRAPESWFEIDLHPASRESFIAALVRERVEGVPELAGHRGTITRLFRQFARSAWDSGAAYCAAMAEPAEDGIVPATVTVSILRGPLDADSDDPDRIGPLLEPFAPKQPSSPGDTWTEILTTELADGSRAGRVCAVEDVEIEPPHLIRVVSMQTFVPVPHVNRVVLVSCASPAWGLAVALLDLFDAITGTLRLFPGDARQMSPEGG
jgi:hypothetical protein